MSTMKINMKVLGFFSALWAIFAVCLGVILFIHDFTGRSWFADAITFGIGAAAVVTYKNRADLNL